MTGCGVAAAAVDGGLSRSLAHSTHQRNHQSTPASQSYDTRVDRNRTNAEGKLISSCESTGAARTSPSIGKNALFFRNYTVWLVVFR